MQLRQPLARRHRWPPIARLVGIYYTVRVEKRSSAYDNIYTNALEEALCDQKGHEAKRNETRKQEVAEREKSGKMVKVFLLLVVLLAVIGTGYFINAEPENAGPLSIGLAVMLGISGIIWWLNR